MKNYYMCGVYLNRGRIILLMCFVPMALILSFAKQIFLAINMDPVTAGYAGTYVSFIIPGLFFHMNYDAIKSYLNGMGYTQVPMIIMFCTCMLHIVWCNLFMHAAGLNVLGASIATMFTYFLNFFLCVIYVEILKRRPNSKIIRESWILPNQDSMQELWPHFKRAINCCFLLILEWWCFEILHLTSSTFGVYQNAAHVIMAMYSFIFYMLPFGIQIAVGCLVG